MIESFINIFFPPLCPLCEKEMVEPRGLCAACSAGITAIKGPACSTCGLPFAATGGSDHLCTECTGAKIPFITARSAVVYKGAAVDGVHLFKYRDRFSLARPFGLMLASAARASISGASRVGLTGGSTQLRLDAIVPVPLHIKRLRARGYNQSLLLARAASKELGVEVYASALKRTRHTRPQIELKHEDRRRNVRGAFTTHGARALSGKNVLLVDDVYTTGATIAECSRVLKKAGARVLVATLARVVSL